MSDPDTKQTGPGLIRRRVARAGRSPGCRHRFFPTAEGLEGRALMSYGGSPDLSFGVAGYKPIDIGGHPANFDNASMAQADGEIVVVGVSQEHTAPEEIRSAWSVARFGTNGDPDTSFGAGGIASPGVSYTYQTGASPGLASAEAVAIQPDGKIVVVGEVHIVGSGGMTSNDAGTTAKVARLDADGSVDTTFGINGVVTLGTVGAADNLLDFGRSVAILPGGEVVVGGAVESVAGQYRSAVERLNPDGSVDRAFGQGGLVVVPLPPGTGTSFNTSTPGATPLAIQADGKIIIETDADLAGGNSYYEIAATRLGGDGSVDSTFGQAGQAVVPARSILPFGHSAYALSMAIQPDGKIIIGGAFEAAPTFTVTSYQMLALRLTADGQPDPLFGIGGFNILGGITPKGSGAGAVALQADGKIVLGDRFQSDFARLNADGLPDPTFGNGGTAIFPVPAGQQPLGGSVGLAIQADGKILSTQNSLSDVLIRVLGRGASGDYDNDGISDPAAFDTTTATLSYLPSGGGAGQSIPIGDTGPGLTLPAPGAYDGGGISEVAVYRPGSGVFEVRPYDGGPAVLTAFGSPGFGQSLPAPGDYDRSGKTEFAVYVTALGDFVYRPAGGGPDVYVPFGIAGAGQTIPAPADYFGTGQADFAAYLVARGAYLIRNPVTGEDYTIPFGTPGAGQAIPVPGDYDGSGFAELAVYVPATGELIYRPHAGGADVHIAFGVAGLAATLPAPGDYDGSGQAEAAGYLPASGTFSYQPAAGGPAVPVPLGVANESVAFSMGTNSVAESGVGAPVVGDYFASNGTSVVTHYSRSGTILGTFTVSGPAAVGGLKGITSNPANGLLYASSSNANGNLTVLAMDLSGVIQQTYVTGSPTGGNLSFGKVTFDDTGHFYVGDGVGVHKFTAGVLNAGTVIFDMSSNGDYDIEALPDGDLIVAGDYDIKEITNTGTLVRQFTPAQGSPGFVNLRGLAFDASTNSLYVSMLGYTGASFRIERFDYATGALLASTTFSYADSLVLTSVGDILVGSRTQAPAIYDADLNYLFQFDGGPQLFATQFQ